HRGDRPRAARADAARLLVSLCPRSAADSVERCDGRAPDQQEIIGLAEPRLPAVDREPEVRARFPLHSLHSERRMCGNSSASHPGLISATRFRKEYTMRGFGWVHASVALALLALSPAGALAQSTIAGVVKDTSGAVLPGVTVEAASPVLIEKTRS